MLIYDKYCHLKTIKSYCLVNNKQVYIIVFQIKNMNCLKFYAINKKSKTLIKQNKTQITMIKNQHYHQF